VAGEDGKTDLLQRRRESLGEARLLSGVATKELAKVEGRDFVFFVEFVRLALRKAISVRLAHLIIAAEFLVERGYACHCFSLALSGAH